TLNVAGSGTTTIWSEATEGHFAKVTTVNATGMTGTAGVTVTGASSAGGFLTGAVLTSFKGGIGIDSGDLSSMTAAQVAAMTAGNLDGGLGRDTLILSSAAATTTTSFNNSNIETIGIVGLTGTVDYSKFGAGVDTFAFTSAQTGAATFNNLTSGL